MIRCYLSGNEVHDKVIRAFYDGCPVEKVMVKGWGYKPSDIAVVFGVHKSKVPVSWPRGEIFRQQRQNKLDVIVLETGYINRGAGETHHYAAGFNGLNGRADFKNKGMPSDRSDKLRKASLLHCLNWKVDGEKIILCGQVPWDASVDHSDHVQWLKKTAGKIQSVTERTIVFRPHPLATLPPLEGCEYSTEKLEYDLEDAHCVVTFNSNSGVEALIRGVPVIACDEGSMAWSIVGSDLRLVETPKHPDRAQWLNDLSYAQWSLEEMRSGEAWRHLLR